jgi:hypothetical protein
MQNITHMTTNIIICYGKLMHLYVIKSPVQDNLAVVVIPYVACPDERLKSDSAAPLPVSCKEPWQKHAWQLLCPCQEKNRQNLGQSPRTPDLGSLSTIITI